MNDKQFDVLVDLLRMTSPENIAAARLVLVAGERPADAVTATGCNRTALLKSLPKLKDAHEKIKKAYG